LLVEGLEDRTLMTILFSDPPNAETVYVGKGPRLGATEVMNIYPIFWGSYWTDQTGNGPAQQQVYQTFLNTTFNAASGYGGVVSGLQQYGVNYPANATQGVDDTDPVSNTSVSDADVQNCITDEITKGAVPNDPNGIYLVIAPPGVGSSTYAAGGYHQSFTSSLGTLHYAQSVNQGYYPQDPDREAAVEAFISGDVTHELFEGMTDPEPYTNPGITTSRGEVCDWVAQYYGALINGYDIPSFWSKSDNAFALYDDNSQVVTWTDGNGGNLTVNGDQLVGNKNDTITVDVNSQGQPLITLNGETYSFSKFDWELGSITINPGGGTNTVNVLNTNVQVTINEGSGTDTVNISPSTQNLDSIQGKVTVNGTGHDTLNVYDQAGPHTGFNYTMTGSYVDRTGSADIFYNGISVVSVYGSSKPSTYSVLGTENHCTTRIIGGGSATVNVGNGGNVQGIVGLLEINGLPNSNAVDIDDSLDPSPRTVTISNSNSGWGQVQFLGLSAPITYAYPHTSSVTVQGGTAGNTWNVLATGVTTAIVDGGRAGGPEGGTGHVNVGNGGSVQGIDRLLEIENPTAFNVITVDDHTDTIPHPDITLSTATYTTFDGRTVPWGVITWLAPAQIRYVNYDTTSVTVKGGHSSTGNTWNVLATGFNYGGGLTTNIVTGGPDHVNVGSVGGVGNGTVQNIFGMLSIEDSPPYRNTLTINDSGDTTTSTRTVTLGTFYNTGDLDEWYSISGLAPAAINFEIPDTTSPVTITSSLNKSNFSYSSTASAGSSKVVVKNNGTQVN